jgi:hypothetical protein
MRLYVRSENGECDKRDYFISASLFGGTSDDGHGLPLKGGITVSSTWIWPGWMISHQVTPAGWRW